MTQKKDNKGFSLVELIVVVAIMAVLMGILVPTLVRNVEKSKKQKDLNAIEEIRNTMQLSLADDKFSQITATVTFSSGNLTVSTMSDGDGSVDSCWSDYVTEVSSQIKDYQCKSKAYKNATVTITIGNELVYFIADPNGSNEFKSENYPNAATGATGATS